MSDFLIPDVSGFESLKCAPAEMALTYKGRTQGYRAWSRELGIKEATIRSRISRKWTVEQALSTPQHSSRPVGPVLDLNNPAEIARLANELGFNLLTHFRDKCLPNVHEWMEATSSTDPLKVVKMMSTISDIFGGYAKFAPDARASSNKPAQINIQVNGVQAGPAPILIGGLND